MAADRQDIWPGRAGGRRELGGQEEEKASGRVGVAQRARFASVGSDGDRRRVRSLEPVYSFSEDASCMTPDASIPYPSHDSTPFQSSSCNIAPCIPLGPPTPQYVHRLLEIGSFISIYASVMSTHNPQR